MIIEIVDKVKLFWQHMKVAYNWQKNLTDICCQLLEFQIGESVFLKIYPMRGVAHFGSHEKLRQRMNGSFKIVKQVGQVS